MNVLLVGSGGREHALAWKISQSNLLNKLYISPGNGGTMKYGENIGLDLGNIDSVAEFINQNDIEMVVVGPEEPLVKGFKDALCNHPKTKNVNIIGPSQQGAMLEGSKDFAKAFMQRHGIPTAGYNTFTLENIEDAKGFLKTLKPPYVLKADGLAAGKGVLILEDIHEAENELNLMLNGKFGNAGNKVVIEEFLDGIELSVFVLTDGSSYLLLPEAKDYKRIGEGNTGLNTGGMGAVSPVPFANNDFMKKVVDRIIEPTVKGISLENIDYKGFIFFGLIKVNEEPFVIEYNVRMGDPETEVVVPRIKNDILQIFDALGNGKLNECTIEIDAQHAATVMMVAGGYPGDYEKGNEIQGLNLETTDSLVFHAGTKSDNGKVFTNGGRVLSITSYGSNIYEALEKSYSTIKNIHFKGCYFRKDLGFDLK